MSNFSLRNFKFWKNNTRYFILLICLICMTLGQANSVSFNFTVICMEGLIAEYHDRNFTGIHWMEDPTKKSIIFSGSAIGATLGLFPSIFLVNRFGVRHIMTIFGLLSATSSLLFPLSVSLSFPTTLVIRILEGIAASVFFIVVTVITDTWSPTAELGMNLAVLSCFFQLSMIICMPISGMLCGSEMGWRAVYYGFGAMTAGFFAVFWGFYRDDPKGCGWVSKRELEVIEEAKIGERKTNPTIPYVAILTDPTVIATYLSFFGADINFLLLILYGPTYLSKVLNFDVIGVGFAAALPYICSILVKTARGKMSDKMVFISVKTRFCIFCGISHVMQAICLMIMSTTDNKLIAQIAFTVAITSGGINITGNVLCLQLRTRQFAHFSMGIGVFIACIISFSTPLVVGLLCPNNTPEEWSRTFLYSSIIVIIFYIPFPIFTSDKPAPYLLSPKKPENQEVVKL